MKLAAIYNVWDGCELLVGSMRSIAKDVDLFIIVHQDISNFGEQYNPLLELPVADMDAEFNIIWIQYHPAFTGMLDEKQKRNAGINVAKGHDCTHFIMMDCDEYYLPGEFASAKMMYLESEVDGSVCGLYTYFKSPELRQQNIDNYYVPFIHRLHQSTFTGASNYPYYVDPTRRVNCRDVVMLPYNMQHYSWVRNDIKRKARNSSAKANIERSSLMSDWETAVEGSIVNGGNLLVKVPDHFGISKMLSTLV